jgi:HEAT repeat protein
VRDAVGGTLRAIGAPAIPALIEQLDAGWHRRPIHEILSRMAPEISVPALLEALNHERAGVRLAVVSVLQNVQPTSTQAIPALQQALNNPDPCVREAAQKALQEIREEEEEAAAEEEEEGP